MAAKKSSRQLLGRGISPGYAVGSAYVYHDMLKQDYAFRSAPQQDVQAEFDRVSSAFEDVLGELTVLAKRVERAMGTDYANILGANRAVLRDPSVLEEVRMELEKEYLNAEEAVKQVFLRQREKFYAMDNRLFRDRGDDIGDLCKRVIRSLLGKEHLLQTLPANAVMVAERLLPTDTILLRRKSVSAVVVESCGPASHAAIFARGMGIPIASGIAHATTAIEMDEEVLVDGITGRVVVAPDADQKARFGDLRREYVKVMEKAQQSCREPALTQDGVRIQIMANVANKEEVDFAAENGAEGIGLYRLEQFYARQRTLPGEDEIADYLRTALQEFKGKVVTIRLLDTGGDKQLPYLDYPSETNPGLGQRGVRLLLDYPALLSSQLKALLSLSPDFPIRILVPMVTLAEDMKAVRLALKDAAQQFNCKAIPALGAIIETPAAAIRAAQIAEFSDFLSIGTNDLTQYVMAAERESNYMSRYYLDDHPAVLWLIRQVCEAVSGHDVEICGELAGNPKAIPILLEMGIRKLSVFALRVPAIKEIIRSLRADGGTDADRHAGGPSVSIQD